MRRNMIGPWRVVEPPTRVTCSCGACVGEVPAGYTISRSLTGEAREFKCGRCGRTVRVGVCRDDGGAP